MMKQANKFTYEREKALGHGVRELASDLRLVEPGDYAEFVRSERFANIANLVASSAELFFKPGTIFFGHSGDVDVTWDETPTVALDMEFRHRRVNVYFRLVLEAQHAAVEITHVAFEGPSEEPDENTKRLVEAIADARLMPVCEADEAAPSPQQEPPTRLGQA